MLEALLMIYLGYKFAFKTRFWRVDEIDLQSGKRRDLEESKEIAEGDFDPKHRPIWRRILRNF